MTSNPAYAAASTGAILVDLSYEGRLRITGADRVTWLQGLVTNDVASLGAGQGCYAAYLTPQGRMISDLRVLALEDAFLIDVPGARRTPVVERLDSFIISEDVAIADLTPDVARIGLHGPQATLVLVRARDVGVDDGGEELASSLAVRLSGLAEHQHIAGELGGHPVIIAGARDIGRVGYDIYGPATTLPDILAALADAGAQDVDAETWDTLRIENGRPVFGLDMDTETIPLEAGIEARAISQTKGCYVGQEVIIRVLHRGGGRVARRLVGLVIANPIGAAGPGPADTDAAGADAERPSGIPDAGAVLRAADRDVGRVTSATWSPALEQFIALGYVHRDFAEPGTMLTLAAEPARAARVSAVPFVRTPRVGP